MRKPTLSPDASDAFRNCDENYTGAAKLTAPLPLQQPIGDSCCMNNSLIQQLPVLLGVGVGTLATYATTSLADRARWRRERTARWDEARMRAYASSTCMRGLRDQTERQLRRPDRRLGERLPGLGVTQCGVEGIGLIWAVCQLGYVACCRGIAGCR